MTRTNQTENRIYVELTEDAQDALVGFPFRDGQCIAEEYEAEDGRDTKFVDIELGDRQDTDTAQEQFLNMNRQVVSYGVR